MKFIFLFTYKCIGALLYCLLQCSFVYCLLQSKPLVRDKEAKASSQLYRQDDEHTMYMMYLRMWLERGCNCKLTKCVFIAELVIGLFSQMESDCRKSRKCLQHLKWFPNAKATKLEEKSLVTLHHRL